MNMQAEENHLLHLSTKLFVDSPECKHLRKMW